MKILFLFLLIVTGILTSYTDCFQRKIKNMHLAVIAITTILLYSALAIRKEIILTPQLIANPLAGVAIGIILYATKLWKAGDAKLFATYSLIITSGKYSDLLPLPCLVLFANIFLVGLLFMMPFLFKNIILNKNKVINQIMSKKTLSLLLNSLIITFGISWIIMPLLELARLNRIFLLSFILMYLGYIYIYKFFNLIKKNIAMAICTVSIGFLVRYIYLPGSFSYANISVYIKYLLTLSLLFHILRIAMEENRAQMQRIPFAPFMLVGALLCYTDFLWSMAKLIAR